MMFCVDEATAEAFRRAYTEDGIFRRGRAPSPFPGDCGQRERPALRAVHRWLAASPAPPREDQAKMPDQIVNAVMADAIQADAARAHPLLGWVVVQYPPKHPAAAFAARLITAGPTPYVLLAESLAELHANLPDGLQRFERQPADPPDVVEVWFPA